MSAISKRSNKYASCRAESYTERIEVKAGRSPEAVAMTESLLDPVIVDFDSWRSVNMTIVAEETGVYYIGIHGISDPDMFWVGIDNPVELPDGAVYATSGVQVFGGL